MKKLSTLIITAVAMLGVGAVSMMPMPVFASAADEIKSGVTAATPAGTNTDLNGTIHTVINIMLYIVGILAVIMIVYSGIRYIISRGEAKEVEGAKNTLMYSIVGLIIAIIAFAIVQWVFTQLT